MIEIIINVLLIQYDEIKEKNQHLAGEIESESATLTLDSMINPKSNKLKLIQMSNIFKKKNSAEEDDFEDEVEEESTKE